MEIKEVVKEKYGQAALRVTAGRAGAYMSVLFTAPSGTATPKS